MPNGVKNWSYRDVKKFLDKNHFILINTRGSHHYYSGHVAGVPRMVTVPFHGSKAILPRTLSSIITQSGLPKSEWLN